MVKLADWLAQFLSDEGALSEIAQSEARIRRAYGELLSGYAVDPERILNETVRVAKYRGIVEVRAIDFISICGHHFLPFFGTAVVRYVPNQVITGLGKIPRVVQALARRFQIQELLTREVALVIERGIAARGVEVETQALHLCMHGRGPRAVGAKTTCRYATGCLDAGEFGMQSPENARARIETGSHDEASDRAQRHSPQRPHDEGSRRSD